MMNAAFLNARRRRAPTRFYRGQAMAPQNSNTVTLTFQDVLDYGGDTDSEDGYDSSDEGATEVDDEEVLEFEEEGQQDADRVFASSIANEVLYNIFPTSATYSSRANAGEPTVRMQEGESREGKPFEITRFEKALKNAIMSYSDKLRVPTSSTSLPKVAQTPPPDVLSEILSDESEDSEKEEWEEEESGFSSDEYDDHELLSARPPFSAEAAAKLFYHPISPWTGLKGCPIENAEVISTLHDGASCKVYLKKGILDGRRITYISKSWPLSQKWKGFYSEVALYADPDYLCPLQGVVVPTIIGVYLVEGAISVAMELPSSDFWVEASEDMPNHLKEKCIDAFDKIHERGVLHNDVELRHMLVSSHGDITIIDFQNSCALKPIQAVGLKATTEADLRLEKRLVRFKLDYEDSRTKEDERRDRVAERGERINQRTRHSVGGSAPADNDEESEPEDPDVVLNPAVDEKTWNARWIGPPFRPRCHIVPEKDRYHIAITMKEFLDKFVTAKVKEDNAPDTDTTPEGQAETRPSTETPSSALVSTASPILPTRINLKRGREHDDETPEDAPSPKKRLPFPAIALLRDSEVFKRSRVSSSLNKDAQHTPGQGDTVSSPATASPPTLDPLVPVVHVPFEGYSGPDGYVLRNIYTPAEVSKFRREWIREHNIKVCKEEGLPYPVAEMNNLAPATQPRAGFRTKSNGRRKQRRSLKNRGALKRTQHGIKGKERRMQEAEERREEYYRNRKEPGTGLSDSEDEENENEDGRAAKVCDDGLPEGGKILLWHELEGSILAGNPHSPIYSFANPELLPASEKPSVPSKGILRRHLTPEEKARNVALLEQYKRKHEQDSDAGNTGDTDTDSQRPAKRPRTSLDPPDKRPATPPPSKHGVGFERYATAPNTFAKSVEKSVENEDKPSSGFGLGFSNPFSFIFGGGGSRSSDETAASSSKESPRPDTVQSGPSCSASSSVTSEAHSHLSARASASSSRSFSDILSDSDSESDDEQGPSSSVWPPRRKKHRRSSSMATNSGPRSRPRLFGQIPIEGPPEEILLPGNIRTRAEIAARRRLTVDEKEEGLWGFKLNFPWKWPGSKR